MEFKIAPSILAADFLHLEKDIRLVNECGDVIHLDVMDGSLVPNISFGFSVIDQVAKIARAPMDAHLMVVHPERWFERLAADRVAMCSFHLEAAGDDTAEFLGRIRALGMQAGVAINPDVPVERLFPYIGKGRLFPRDVGVRRLRRAEVHRRIAGEGRRIASRNRKAGRAGDNRG